jgi:hypothetical protein
MGSSPEPAVPAYRRLRMPWKRPQVLGVDLNRSESRGVMQSLDFSPLIAPTDSSGGTFASLQRSAAILSGTTLFAAAIFRARSATFFCASAAAVSLLNLSIYFWTSFSERWPVTPII